MGIPEEKIYNNIQEYADTRAASIPIARHEALKKGLLRPGRHALGEFRLELHLGLCPPPLVRPPDGAPRPRQTPVFPVK